MKTRIISGLIMVPLLLVLYFGGVWLWAAAAAISLGAINEFYKGFENMGLKPGKNLGLALTAGLYAGVIGLTYEEFVFQHELVLLWLFVAIAASMIYGWKITERGPYDAIATIAGVVYIPFFAVHIVLLDNTEYHLFTWLIVLAAFGSDIFAYFTGFAIGKHKMAPNLSPKKTIEGAVGGVVGGTLLCGLFGYFFTRDVFPLTVVLGLVGSLAAEAGDLTASAFKRKMEIKDYGNLIPGHGGVLDRFDSVIFVAPVIYYITIVFTGLIG
jgi:phosphatidate cytidylyltransferase